MRLNHFVIAQKASPIWRMKSFQEANIVFTSFPYFVSMFKHNGINSEYLKLAFGTRVLKEIPKQKKNYNCTFVGGISGYHSTATKILGEVANNVRLDVFGYGKNTLDHNSNLYKNHHGEVWGKDMYKVMMQSKMTINRHINIAGKYANNMRLFEATGSGAMLLTDNKVNLDDFFEIGKEAQVYNDASDLVKKIKYYSANPEEREKIARAGQNRTLKDHTYKVRMLEMLKLVIKYRK